ncbi:hypothetical protein DO97_15520 [Neosynechococcus sphagnicola sy1]|uniref:Uncharacterized protein n=1 Tax=Neosynechococcus sphagnicola sy1 TaxID=1497020 RepID=A0A098TID9_9CYAN|nr:hypothetical protein DO97_15520 [Neosynechococcus sphagnicola sy1]
MARSHLWPSFYDPQPAQDGELLRQLAFVPGLKEFLMLRQVHALEHATVWVLSGRSSQPLSTGPIDDGDLGGLSTDQGFYIYGQVQQTQVRRAVTQALYRLTTGEWELALHPRCGTNLSVGMLLLASLAVGIHVVFPRGPLEQLLGLGLAATTAAQLTPDLGRLTQQYLMTAIPFNLEIAAVRPVLDGEGRFAYFVQVQWIESSCP